MIFFGYGVVLCFDFGLWEFIAKVINRGGCFIKEACGGFSTQIFF